MRKMLFELWTGQPLWIKESIVKGAAGAIVTATIGLAGFLLTKAGKQILGAARNPETRQTIAKSCIGAFFLVSSSVGPYLISIAYKHTSDPGIRGLWWISYFVVGTINLSAVLTENRLTKHLAHQEQLLIVLKERGDLNRKLLEEVRPPAAGDTVDTSEISQQITRLLLDRLILVETQTSADNRQHFFSSTRLQLKFIWAMFLLWVNLIPFISR